MVSYISEIFKFPLSVRMGPNRNLFLDRFPIGLRPISSGTYSLWQPISFCYKLQLIASNGNNPSFKVQNDSRFVFLPLYGWLS